MNQFLREELENILIEAMPEAKPRPAAVTARLRAYDWFDFNLSTQLPPLEQSERARAIRAIERIAGWYRWQAAVERALDKNGVEVIEALGDGALFELRDRMESLLNAAQAGCDLDEELPAR